MTNDGWPDSWAELYSNEAIGRDLIEAGLAAFRGRSELMSKVDEAFEKWQEGHIPRLELVPIAFRDGAAWQREQDLQAVEAVSKMRANTAMVNADWVAGVNAGTEQTCFEIARRIKGGGGEAKPMILTDGTEGTLADVSASDTDNPKSVDNPKGEGQPRFDNMGHRLCNARNDTCTRWAMVSVGSSKCNWHGGKTPRGIASPHYRGKGQSKYMTALPGRLQEDLKAARKRQRDLSNQDEIEVIEVRLRDVLKQIEARETDAVWLNLREQWSEFEAAMRDKNLDRAMVTVPKIAELINKGGEDWQIWGEACKLIEQHRKLVESESKILLQQQETLTSQQANLLYDALLTIIVEEVSDREIRSRMQNRFIRIIQGVPEARRLNP